MKILITNHHLDSRAGSELFTATLAVELKKRNHQVSVFSPILGTISEEIKKNGVIVVDDLRMLKEEKFDIIHAQHNTIAILARSIFPNVPMIFMSHGVLPELEQSPSIDLGIERFIAVSEEVKENLINRGGAPEEKIVIVRNFVDTEIFYSKKSVNPNPKNLLVISNHYIEDVKDVIESACADLGVAVLHIGLPDNPVVNVEKYINDADIVVTLGRGALEAMACERNVIVLDMHGGDGFVDEQNFFEIRKNNFSGRRFKRKYSIDDFKKEIKKYNPNLGKTLRGIIKIENNVDVIVGNLEDIYDEVSKEMDIKSQITTGQLYDEIFFLEKTLSNIINLNGLIIQKEQEIQQTNQVIQQANQVIQQNEQEISDLVQLSQQKEKEINKKNQEALESKLLFEQKDQEIQQKTQEIQQKDQEIQYLISSKFWKARMLYLGLKFAIFSPMKFVKKYKQKIQKK